MSLIKSQPMDRLDRRDAEYLQILIYKPEREGPRDWFRETSATAISPAFTEQEKRVNGIIQTITH